MKNIIPIALLHIVILTQTIFAEKSSDSSTAMCYALTDDSNKLYKVTMSPNSDPLPVATTINISSNFNGEGSAYRATNNTFYAFTGKDDDKGPSHLYSINIDTGVTKKLKNEIIKHAKGTVEGAEFYYNPSSKKEILYIISREDDSKLYAFDPDNNWEILTGYPKDTQTDLSSLAIDPMTGVGYAIDDYNYDNIVPKLYSINLATGETTFKSNLQNIVDAEGLAFASDGNLYIEDEGRLDESSFPDKQRLYKVNINTGALTPSAITNSDGDIEGLSCNGTAMLLKNKDFGDAPNNYSHVSHQISSNLYLGNKVPDSEDDQQSSLHATDDGDDDSDGVVNSLPTLIVGGHSYTIPVKVFNNTSKDAYITAWIDFNRNGTFEFSEALNTNNLKISSSDTAQTVNVVWDDSTDEEARAINSVTAGKAIMRIRLTTERILRYIEDTHKDADENLFAPDGEIEDYEITVTDSTVEAFECTTDGYLFSSIINDTFTNLSTIDLTNKIVNDNVRQFAKRHINAAGYNVKDNLIYGMGFKNVNKDRVQLIQVGKNFETVAYDVEGLPQGPTLYAHGDVDFNNKLYVSYIVDQNGVTTNLNKLIIIDLLTKKVVDSIPLDFSNTTGMTYIKSADYAFNPKDDMLYTIDMYTKQLLKINPESGLVTSMGVLNTEDNVYSVMNFFDKDGTFYFSNNGNTKLYSIDLSDIDKINLNPILFKDGFDLDDSGDGVKCAYSTVTKPKLEGQFNVERTDSGNYTINSYKRNAWYTQIVGRDFDYSVVFYDKDMQTLKELNDVVIKVDLMDEMRNQAIYTNYYYFNNSTPVNRIDVISGQNASLDDLATLPATQKARFRISYGVDGNGSIIKSICKDSPKTCFENFSNTTFNNAKDNFAIRPETFNVTIADKETTLRNSRANNTTPLRLATGYEYNLTVIATQYRANNSIVASPNYVHTIDRWLRFKTAGVCQNSEDNRTDENFDEGKNSTNSLKFQEVGLYSLEIEDENWTLIDQNKTDPNLSDCLLGTESERNIPNVEGKVGCHIQTQSSNINILFQPYKFKINLEMEEDNIPNSSHPDFLYMMNGIDSTNNDVAIQFEGEITAQSKDDINLTNFTAGCVANDINLSIDITTLSEDGNNTIIRTAPSNTGAREDVKFTRVILYNKDTTNKQVDINSSLLYANSDILIKSDKFLDENKGTTYLQIRYNLNKNSSKTINPVQLTFHKFDVNSSSSFSETNTTALHYPLGKEELGDTIRNFYFSQVAPDSLVYPTVNCITHSNISTPVNVDIFCDVNLTYCTQTGVMGHTTPLSSPRASGGFYSSVDHNQTVDGTITKLIHTDNLRTNPNPDNANPLEFSQGRNGLLTTKFIAETKEKVSILPSDALLFNPDPSKNGQSEYEVSCSNEYNSSQWTGLGKTGNVLNINANSKNTHKMDW